jgi:hypothetical protein
MTKRRSPSLAFFALALLSAIPALAQNSRYSTDCEAARQALSINNPGQLAPCLSTKQMVQMQVASTVIDAFVNMLFSNDSQANEQKQKMMAELQARQAEAERQKQHEEALRLAAICSRLQTTLKQSGLPQLQLKSSGQAGGLRLKLGDSGDGHVGVPGLPGIALNDNTGNGGSSPYGVRGLPGIYTNGPAMSATAPSGGPPSSAGGPALKLGDPTNSSSAPAQQTQASPSEQSGLLVDPRAMTPQQLADLASNLPPEQQQQLLNALQTGSSASAPASPVSSAAASSPALGQLQQTAAASSAAAVAKSPEAARSDAKIGFDQAAGGSLSIAPANGGGVTAPTTSSDAQPSAVATTGTSSHSAANPSIPTTVNQAVLAPPTSLRPASSGSVDSTAAPLAPQPSHSAPALSRIQQMTDQQLQDETCRARAILLRIGADSQKSSQELDEMAKEIRETRREAVKTGLGCFSELAEKALSDKLDDKLDGEEKRTHDAAFEKDAKELLKKAQDLQTEISKTTLEYQENDHAREDKLEAALSYLNALYEYVRKEKAFPWVASAQCAIDFGYLATKVYTEQQQISLLNNNQDSAAGSLKAESSVAAFHKKLVDESLRRGLDPKAACH